MSLMKKHVIKTFLLTLSLGALCIIFILVASTINNQRDIESTKPVLHDVDLTKFYYPEGHTKCIYRYYNSEKFAYNEAVDAYAYANDNNIECNVFTKSPLLTDFTFVKCFEIQTNIIQCIGGNSPLGGITKNLSNPKFY